MLIFIFKFRLSGQLLVPFFRLNLVRLELIGVTGQLFVPFTDGTSGNETYGGGRYLDLQPTATGAYVVDFNRAYHPYCVYDPSFVCPVPPEANRLRVRVRSRARRRTRAAR